MNQILEDRIHRQTDSEKYMETVIKLHKKKPLTDLELKQVMKRMYSYGHYVGHCQGEYHVKQTYGLLDS